MNNDAFKDLVRKQANVESSSKEIARKAVEDEFRKKKKRKRGGGYASSSDEEDDGDNKRGKKNKGRDKDEKDEESDTEKAIQEDLASRYRDRAKERREGGIESDHEEDEDNQQPVSLASTELLIVPHNKKGLDLSLVRKERQGLQKAGAVTAKEESQEPTIEMRKEMPSMEEAFEILRNHVQDPSPSVKLSRGLANYLRGYMEWKSEGIKGKYDTVTCGTSGKTLQNTKLAFAIDGHPSDTRKAWQKPRQFTVSEGAENNSGSSSAMLTSEVVDQVDRIFTARRRMLSEMKEATTTAVPRPSSRDIAASQSKTKDTATAKTPTAAPAFDDDDDDDIFGGLDDYVPPVPKKKD